MNIRNFSKRVAERLRFPSRFYCNHVPKPVIGQGTFFRIGMKKTILFLCFLCFAKVGHAQLGCNRCLILQPDPYGSWCRCCDTARAWILTDGCDSCITTIQIRSKSGKPFMICCAVTQDTNQTPWTVTEGSDTCQCVWTLQAPVGSCLNTVLQFTTCGLNSGDAVYLSWAPADPPCGPMAQDEEVGLP